MADSGVVNRDGFGLAWVREGTGTPMLVVGAQRYYRRAFPAQMRDHFEMVFCDLRQWVPTPSGFDLSTLTLRTWNDDIEAIRMAAGLEQPIVAGHSHHGSLALAYAHDYPTNVRGVVPIGASPPFVDLQGQELSPEFFERDADPARKSAHQRNTTTRPMHEAVTTASEFVDNYVANGAMTYYDPTFDGRSLWEGVDINLAVVNALYQPNGLAGWQLEPNDLPTFLALGRYDYGVPYYAWDEPKKRLLNLRYKLYGSSAHTPPLEQPEDFTADIVDWAKNF